MRVTRILILLHGFGENQVYPSWPIAYLLEWISVFFMFTIKPARKYSLNTDPLEPKEFAHHPPAMLRLHPQSLLLGMSVSISQTSPHYQVGQLASGGILKFPV